MPKTEVGNDFGFFNHKGRTIGLVTNDFLLATSTIPTGENELLYEPKPAICPESSAPFC